MSTPNATSSKPVLSLEEQINEFGVQMKKAKRDLRKAQESETEAKRVLALRCVDVREARLRLEAIEDAIHAYLDMTPAKREKAVLGWDEVWCPHCKHTFVPSKPGGPIHA